MPKTLVCVMSKQLLPNYLFLKDFASEGDRIFLITTSQTYEKMDFFYDLLKKNLSKSKIQTLYFENKGEEQWQYMKQKFVSSFSKKEKEEYLVNLTGGTKYMAIALYEYFREKPNARILYSPWPSNVYLDFVTDETIPIKYSVTREEYFALSNLKFAPEDDFLFGDNGAYSKGFFNHFINFTDREHAILTEAKKHQNDWGQISQQNCFWSLLEKINFPLNKEVLANLSSPKREKIFKYIFGCWFEEYVRVCLAERIETDVFGVKGIQMPNAPKNNELDCVIIKNNKCVIGECKTYIEQEWIESAINKAFRINQNIISTLSASSYLFYINCAEKKLSAIQNALKQAEKTRALKVYGKEYFLDDEKFAEMIKDIKRDLGYQNVN